MLPEVEKKIFIQAALVADTVRNIIYRFVQIMPMRFNPSWRYWKTPVLFGAGLCILQTLVAIVRFGGRESWNPIILLEIPFILLGLIMFFLCGLLIGLLVQRLLKGSSGAWRSTLMVAVALATPLAVWFSLVGGLLGPPGILFGALIPYLLLVGILVLIHTCCLRLARSRVAKKRS